MRAVVIGVAVLFPLWFVAVFFVGAHVWLSYETASTKGQVCNTMKDEVGISISYSAYKAAGCPG